MVLGHPVKFLYSLTDFLILNVPLPGLIVMLENTHSGITSKIPDFSLNVHLYLPKSTLKDTSNRHIWQKPLGRIASRAVPMSPLLCSGGQAPCSSGAGKVPAVTGGSQRGCVTCLSEPGCQWPIVFCWGIIKPGLHKNILYIFTARPSNKPEYPNQSADFQSSPLRA